MITCFEFFELLLSPSASEPDAMDDNAYGSTNKQDASQNQRDPDVGAPLFRVDLFGLNTISLMRIIERLSEPRCLSDTFLIESNQVEAKDGDLRVEVGQNDLSLRRDVIRLEGDVMKASHVGKNIGEFIDHNIVAASLVLEIEGVFRKDGNGRKSSVDGGHVGCAVRLKQVGRKSDGTEIGRRVLCSIVEDHRSFKLSSDGLHPGTHRSNIASNVVFAMNYMNKMVA